MKHLLLTAAAILAAASTAGAASLERVGAKVAGEATWVTAIRLVTPDGAMTITTEDMAKGRDLGDTIIAPAGSFNPANPRSALAWVRANYGGAIHVQTGGDINSYVTVATPGDDGQIGTADDGTARRGVRGHDNW